MPTWWMAVSRHAPVAWVYRPIRKLLRARAIARAVERVHRAQSVPEHAAALHELAAVSRRT